MMTLEEAKTIASRGDYDLIPLTREILSDIRTPLETLRALQAVSTHCFLLESVEDQVKWGRYTFLGFDPDMELTCKDHKLFIRSGGRIEMEVNHPADYLKKLLDENKSPRLEGLPPFTGGLVGYFSYDYIKYSEPSLNLASNNENDFSDMDLMLFKKLIAYDNLTQKIVLIVNIATNSIETEYNRGILELDTMEKIVRSGQPKEIIPGKLLSDIKPLFNKEEFCRKVERVKHHIFEGDIFQLVLSNPMEAEYEGSLLNMYRVLRTTNPSPYMFYFSGDVEIAGASPETLVQVRNGEVMTFPLAGTRKRGKTIEEDLELEKELLADEKERAEHNMLVDLGRNDLGRICDFGTVKVEKYMSVERYSHVMHIGSSVKGHLKDNLSAIDAIDAVLPAGTLSGAPKIRACQLIDELEDNKRGIYGGAIGYIDFTGNLDTCIAIRLA
ncbi:MAG: chorismate-binding protein, partial [Lachnospiraceae bacterium]|nr:chorismate-binding protein [Lachnospiraceae bacterium]